MILTHADVNGILKWPDPFASGAVRNYGECWNARAEQGLAADGAIAGFSKFFSRRMVNADRAPQLKALVRLQN